MQLIAFYGFLIFPLIVQSTLLKEDLTAKLSVGGAATIEKCQKNIKVSFEKKQGSIVKPMQLEKTLKAKKITWLDIKLRLLC